MRNLWLALLLAVIVAGCQGAASQEPEAPALTPSPSGQSASVPRPAAPVGKSGTTYYVDISGDDANDGSGDSPWRTLQHAVDSVAPGDTIIVRGGTYEGMRIERSGTADAWITLKAAPEARVIVNAPGPNNRHGSNIEAETWEGGGIVAYWTIQGLEVTDALNQGIDLRGSEARHSHHFALRGNNIHDNGLETGKSGIFAAFVDDIVIENNASYGNGEHGIYLSNSGDRFLVRGNRLHNNAFCGLHMNGDASQGGDGIISQGTIENNIIYENGTEGCAAINMDGVRNAVVRNNLLYMNHAGGISMFQQDGAICSQDNRVFNNTVVMAEDGRWAINISGENCINNQIFNNILYSHHEWRGSISIPAARIPGFESDYNVLMDRLSTSDGDSLTSLAQWQALGYDTNSLVATPDELFVDPDGHDYRLRADSLAIDAGLTTSDMDEDMMGRPRPQGGSFDIGAFESDVTRVQPTQAPTVESAALPAAEGVITFALGGRVYRSRVAEGAAPEDISLALESLSPIHASSPDASGSRYSYRDSSNGQVDAWLNVSPDGGWLVLETERFDAGCKERACLAVVAADLSAGEAVMAGGELVHPRGFSAIASGGNLIVYPAGGGPHQLDLWAVERQEAKWSAPRLLTVDSPYAWNYHPAISADGRMVVFNCGQQPSGAEGTAICEVGAEGRGFSVLLRPEDATQGLPEGGALHSPDYAPDGSIVFEAGWDGEHIWRLAAPGAQPLDRLRPRLERVGSGFDNDNSPCVLSDGSIVSLWLGRAGGPGLHEVKLMASDGEGYTMLLKDADVEDVGIGCGK